MLVRLAARGSGEKRKRLSLGGAVSRTLPALTRQRTLRHRLPSYSEPFPYNEDQRTVDAFEGTPVTRGRCNPVPMTCDAAPTLIDTTAFPEWGGIVLQLK